MYDYKNYNFKSKLISPSRAVLQFFLENFPHFEIYISHFYFFDQFWLSPFEIIDSKYKSSYQNKSQSVFITKLFF